MPVRSACAPLLAAALLLLPAVAGAQNVVGLLPPELPPTPEVIAEERRVIATRRDSVAQAERLDLRAWVDSAATALEAGAPPEMEVPPLDPSAPPVSARPLPPVTPREGVPPRAPTTVFREGAPAPSTATPLPLLVVVGSALAGAGAWLRRRG